MKHCFCFYHVRVGKHVLYHHVIIETDDYEMLKVLIEEDYQYYLMSYEVVSLSEKDINHGMIRNLIMDGESLLKRLKKAKINNNDK